jgi:putative transposase
MIKTYKYRLYPTKKQVQKLELTLDICRILYNSCLLDRKNTWEKTGKGLSYNQQCEILTQNKKTVLFLKEIHSQVLQDVLLRVDKSFQNFFRRIKQKQGKAGYPRFKAMNRYDSFCYPQSGFEIVDGKLKLSKIGTIKLKLHRKIVGQIKTCTIKKELDRWYACFSVEHQPQKRPVPTKSIGIDVGLTNFATLSNVEVIENPRHLRKSENKLKLKQRLLSKKIKGSNNRTKARTTLAKLHRKVRNQRLDFHHQESRKLVNEYGFIAVEDLQIKNMVQNHHLAKSISDAGWGQFLSLLKYKAEEAGSWVEKVGAYYTSQICSHCGELVKKTLSQRVHLCTNCGLLLDRDHNAAINIINKSTAGTAGFQAWGETTYQSPSTNQEVTEFLTQG